jgi:hypothetical protein
VRAALLLLTLLPVLIAPDAVERAAAIGVGSGDTYYPGGHAFLLLLIVPLHAQRLCPLLLPGVLLASLVGKASSVTEGLFYGFVLSLLVVSLASGVAQALLGDALRGRMYAGVLACLTVAPCCSVATRTGVAVVPAGSPAAQHAMPSSCSCWRSTTAGAQASLGVVQRGRRPRFSRPDCSSTTRPILVPGCRPRVRIPGNDLHAVRLSQRLVPAVVSRQYAVRVPFLLYLPVLAAGIMVVASRGRRDASQRLSILGAVLASLACYGVAMSFSATYTLIVPTSRCPPRKTRC